MKGRGRTDILLLGMCQGISEFTMHRTKETSCPLSWEADGYSNQPTRTWALRGQKGSCSSRHPHLARPAPALAHT